MKKKNIKLLPVTPPPPLVALFSILLGIVPPKALTESQGVILYFSTELVGIPIRKEKYNQLGIYKFYEWKHVEAKFSNTKLWNAILVIPEYISLMGTLFYTNIVIRN